MSESKNIALLGLWALIIGFQVVIAAGVVSYFFPLSSDSKSIIFPEFHGILNPSRDLLLYRIFLLAVMAAFAALAMRFRNSLESRNTYNTLKGVLIIESFGLPFLGFGLFQGFFWKDALLCSFGLIIGLLWAAVAKAGHVPLTAFLNKISEILSQSDERPRFWMDAIVILLLCVLLCPSSIDAVVAVGFVNDSFYHFDGDIVSAAYAQSKGLKPNIDFISQYGIAVPFVYAKLAQWLGGVTYENVTRVLVALTIVFYYLIFVFLRGWLKSSGLAFAGMMAALYMKFIFSWYGPHAVPGFRNIAEMLFFPSLLAYLRFQRTWILALTGAIGGAAFCYIFDTGTYLCVIYYFALTVFFITSMVKDKLIRFAGLALVPVVTILAGLSLILGPQFMTREFWLNTSEHGRFFLAGFGAVPLYKYLKGQYLESFMPFAALAMCILTAILFTFKALKSRRCSEDMVAACLSVYGILQFNYFICRGLGTSFRAIAVPFVLVICFWASLVLKGMPVPRRNWIIMMASAGLVFVFMASRLYIDYPSLLNVRASKQVQKNVETYQTQGPTVKDIELIASLTNPQDRVPVISSFEVLLLMKANRSPLFYYFPLIHSGPFQDGQVKESYLYTPQRVNKILEQINRVKPKFIFVAKEFLYEDRPEYRWMLQNMLSHQALMAPVMVMYEPFAAGDHVVALKRKQAD